MRRLLSYNRANDARYGRVLSALSKSPGKPLVCPRHAQAHSNSTLQNPQKSAMHPCVRCVSEMLARSEVSQPLPCSPQIPRQQLRKRKPSRIFLVACNAVPARARCPLDTAKALRQPLMRPSKTASRANPHRAPQARPARAPKLAHRLRKLPSLRLGGVKRISCRK